MFLIEVISLIRIKMVPILVRATYVVQIIGKIFVIFIELCMKGTLLAALRGNNSYETCIYNFELSQKKCANGVICFTLMYRKYNFMITFMF